MSRYSRKDWIFRSHFHALSGSEVLDLVEQRVHQIKSQAKTPVILFDLDSTLYEVGPRTLAILKEWNQKPSAALTIQETLNKVELEHVGYSLLDTLKNLGCLPNDSHTDKAHESLKPFWWKRFFSNPYLHHDRPYIGAVKFAQKMNELGCHLIYLTGREEAKMKVATLDNLTRDAFPTSPTQTTLVMKPSGDLSDVEHKRNVASVVHAKGILVASFENEPMNLVALAELFPQAMHVFMETIHSEHPAPLGKSLYKIKDFKREK